MDTVPATITSTRSASLVTIFWAGLACGVLDITAAFIVWGLKGITPVRILQSIASGALGPSAFQGGAPAAALGAGFHFLIAFTAAAVFYIASRRLTFMVLHPWIWGPVYGIAVYFFMNQVVLRLSAARKAPFSLNAMVIGLIVHVICVGLPIALTIRRYSRT